MTTLLTGATGFVGGAVLRSLVAAGHRVRALVRPNSNRLNLAGADCEIVTGDLVDMASLERAVRGCEAVFHVAADYRLWVPDREKMDLINVQGTVNLLRAAEAAGAARIVYTSSVATLHVKGDGTPADETSHAELEEIVGAYKQSKFLAEREVKRLVQEKGMPVVIVNPAAPFGPGDVKPTPTGRMIVAAASGRIPVYVDTGLNVVHVDDVAAGHLLAYERGAIGERYILGGENRTLRWILERVAELSGRPPPRIRLPHWCVMPAAYLCEALARGKISAEPMVTVDGVRMARKLMYFSSEKARRELGYSPRPAIEALRDAVDWFYRHGYIKPAKA
ncbi:MAG TPA: hopanoid-associated sugar epimerase [Candidatus Acidoferrales bacterium]|nr:hopanoid-associated sugar epimerase [Candidatus Acidoferrales bacterium]